MGSDERDSYLLLLKRQVRDLHGLLKMRLRVELPSGSSSILASLNEKLLSFSEISNDFETLYSDLLERSKIANDCIMKANLYDSLSVKAKETESLLRSEVEQLSSRVRLLEDENARLRTSLTTANEELLQRVEEVAKYRVQSDSLEIDMKAKKLELSRVAADRDTSKRQCLNLSSLLKQVAEEKDVKAAQVVELKQQLNAAEKQLSEERKEINAAREREKNRREQSLAVKDQELNEELALLQAQLAHKKELNSNSQLNQSRKISSHSSDERKPTSVSSSVQLKALSTSEVRDDSSDDGNQQSNQKLYSKHQVPRVNSHQDDSEEQEDDEEEQEEEGSVEVVNHNKQRHEDDYDDDDDNANGIEDKSNHTASFGDSSEGEFDESTASNQIKRKEAEMKLKKNLMDEESNEEDELSLDGGIENVKFDDGDFSENDSIDLEVKRRIQIKQQLQQSLNQDNRQPQRSQSSSSSSRAQTSERVMQTTEQSSIVSASLEQLKKSDLVLSRSSSEESLVREAEKARELQRKRNQQRFEMNKLKLVSSKKTLSSDEENS